MGRFLSKTEAAEFADDLAVGRTPLDIESLLRVDGLSVNQYRACEAFDNGNKQPLVKLLWGQEDTFLKCIADLLERSDVTLKHPAHRPSTPAYKRSAAEAVIHRAKHVVKDCVKEGMLQSDAVEFIAPKFGLDQKTLDNACLGKRASTRRFAKRIKK